MKKIWALLLCVGAHAASAHNWEIVSDYDDTVKIANAKDAGFDTLLRAILSNEFFPGMSELYGVWVRDSDLAEIPLHFISSSPKQLRAKIRRDLEERGAFPEFRLSLRDWFTERDSAAYKRGKLREYLERDNPLILLGDDTEQDPQIYAELSEERPVLATYIRYVSGQPLAEGQRPFATALDIAAHEFLEGRLSEEDVLAVADATFAGEPEDLLPDFVSCEGLRAFCLDLPLEGALRWSCLETGVRLQELCRIR
jgi:hypothetical protein